jgi:hypothetical protein
MLRLIVLFLLVGTVHSAHGQNSINDLFKVFKKSIKQESSKKVAVGSNPWIICNKDSAYYRSDTLILYNDKNYQYRSNCCDFVEWTFYRKDAFFLGQTKICQEPPIGIIHKDNNWFTIQSEKGSNGTKLELVNSGRVVERFKLISIGRVNPDQKTVDYNVVTLERIH